MKRVHNHEENMYFDQLTTHKSSPEKESNLLQYAPIHTNGSITLHHVPYSKSYLIRVLAMAMLAGAIDSVDNFRSPERSCRDINVMREALLTLCRTDSTTIPVEDAGTVWRFIVAIASLRTDRTINFSGRERLFNRPIVPLIASLRALGADISFDPTDVRSMAIHTPATPLRAGHITSDTGALSSQFLSALMLIAPYLQGHTRIDLSHNQRSKPYTELTYKLMQEAGAKILVSEEYVEIEKGSYNRRAVEQLIQNAETDWTALSYLHAWCAMPNGPKSIFVPDCFRESMQGDVALLKLISSFGVATRFFPHGILIERIKSAEKNKLVLDFVANIDLVPTFVVLCLALARPFHFKRISALRLKESDRIEGLLNMAKNLGYAVEATDDDLFWEGQRIAMDRKACIDPCGDHRLAMAASIFAFVEDGVQLQTPEVVEKSYPYFWEDARRIGLFLK